MASIFLRPQCVKYTIFTIRFPQNDKHNAYTIRDVINYIVNIYHQQADICLIKQFIAILFSKAICNICYAAKLIIVPVG